MGIQRQDITYSVRLSMERTLTGQVANKSRTGQHAY